MEERGYRVESVFLNYFFSFAEKKKANQAAYFLNRYFPKDFDSELYDWEMELKRQYGANPVKTKWSNIELLRVRRTIADTELQKRGDEIRNQYYIRGLFRNLLIDLFFLADAAVLLLFGSEGAARICGVIGFVVFLGLFLWNLAARIVLKRRMKELG